MRRKHVLVLLLTLLVFLGLVQTVGAQSTPTPFPPDRIGPPEIEPPILPPPARGVRIEYQRVDVEIDSQVATTRIDQLFVNENDWLMEGTYLFPLPEGAAVTELTMWVDGQPIEAKVLNAGEARQIYDEIVRQLRDPALLEYVGSSAIQANVFPIPPHDERRIEIEYTQVLPADNGLVRYIYPQSSNLYTNLPLESQSIRVEVRSNDAIRSVYSPSHPVAVERPGEFSAVVGYEDVNVQPDRDFELFYSVSPNEIGLNLLSYKEAGEDGFFLLLVAPTIEVDPDAVIARDVILVLDTSGSMHGEKLAQAQEAGRFVLNQLNPGDRFNIVSFSTGTRSYAPTLVPAAEADRALSFVNSLEAVGGTNISQALLEAVDQADAERPLTIIFLTDGLATEGIVETPLLLDAVAQSAPESTRLFAFGVGDDVDTILLDTLTQDHRGTTTYVRPGEAIDEAVSSFYAKVSTPVLADISLEFGDVIVEQIYPPELPDLFAGTQLVLTGRYREGGPATITLSGEVNGVEQRFEYLDQTFRQDGGEEFIPRLWATRAIGHLLREIRLNGEQPELVQSVVNLSIRYGIITPYTSYLIEEDDIFTQTGREMIFEEAAEELSAVEAPSGAEAVMEAEAAADLAAAEAPVMPTPLATAAPGTGSGYPAVVAEGGVRQVGSKTFIFRDGRWLDTAYEADRMTPQRVGFASEAYFDLLDAAPELGQYLALGERVLVVFRDTAYEIVAGEGSGDITLPESVDEPEVAGPGILAAEEAPEAELASENTGSSLCFAALALPLFFTALGATFYDRRRRSGR